MKSKKNQKTQQFAITEEEKQNDPFVRAIAKKVRNINKKLLDIENLEKRGDLKPEQLQKINSKQNTLDERKKYEDFVKFYRTTLAEAANDKQAKQISPIVGKLANSLVLAHYLSSGVEVKDLQLTAQEKKVVTNLASVGREAASLQDLGAQLSGYFAQYLDSQKLVTKIESAFSNNVGATVVNLYKKHQTQTHSQPKQQQKVEQKQTPIKPVVEQTPTKPAPQVVVEPVRSSQKETVPEPKQEEPKQTVPAPVAEQPKQETAAENTTTQAKPQATGQTTGQVVKQNTNKGGDRTKKPYQTNKRPYKPKYNEKKDNEDQGEEEDDEERSKFNNKQMRELVNDGFIIVQKKQKPKDPRESENYSRKQHGFKDKRPHAHHN